MRLHFQLTPNTQTVPFDYQHFLTGAFHKWLGDNTLRDGISLYSLGWLHGGVTRRHGRRIQGGLDFPNGARWFISAHDETLLQRITRRVPGWRIVESNHTKHENPIRTIQSPRPIRASIQYRTAFVKDKRSRVRLEDC